MSDALPRVPFTPLLDPAAEDFCKARAAGKTIVDSARFAQIGKTKAFELSKDPECTERVREIRDGSATLVTVSVGWVVSRLQKNATESAEAGQFKPSNEALKLLYEIVSKNKDFAGGLRLNPGSSAAALRKAVAEQLGAQPPALPPPPAMNELDAIEAEAEEVA